MAAREPSLGNDLRIGACHWGVQAERTMYCVTEEPEALVARVQEHAILAVPLLRDLFEVAVKLVFRHVPYDIVVSRAAR